MLHETSRYICVSALSLGWLLECRSSDSGVGVTSAENNTSHLNTDRCWERERDLQNTHSYRLRSHKLDFPPSAWCSVLKWKKQEKCIFQLLKKPAFCNKEFTHQIHTDAVSLIDIWHFLLQRERDISITSSTQDVKIISPALQDYLSSALTHSCKYSNTVTGSAMLPKSHCCCKDKCLGYNQWSLEKNENGFGGDKQSFKLKQLQYVCQCCLAAGWGWVVPCQNYKDQQRRIKSICF